MPRPSGLAARMARALGALLRRGPPSTGSCARSDARHTREQGAPGLDALTGLLDPSAFHEQLQQAVARYEHGREDAAVVLVELVNHAAIQAQHGAAVAEQSLLRSVMKLRRVLRDVDVAGRLGQARFGLVLQGVGSRVAVTDRAARLVAAGLMPLPGLQPEVTLHFHLAAVLLRERLLAPPALLDALGELLAGMAPRTHRPVRFLLPEDTMPVALEPDDAAPLAR